MRPTPAFVNLLDDVLGEHSWQVNLQTRSFTFDTERGTVECTDFHFLGTAAPGPDSWLWSWANRSGFPESVAALAASVREFGVEHEIGELSAPELPFDSLPFDQPEPYQVAAVLTEAVKAATGHWTGYQGPAGDDGTRAAFLVEHPDFRLPPAEGARVLRTLTEGLSGLALYDQRRALNSYLSLRGLNPVFSADEGQLIVDSPVLAGTIEFDEHGVAASLELTELGSL